MILEFLQMRRQHFETFPDMVDMEWQSFVDGILMLQHQAMSKVSKGHIHGDKTRGDGYYGDKTSAALAPDDHFVRVLFDFFEVGCETSLVGLLWVIQMVMFYPQWQKRIQDELDQVVELGH